MTHRDSDSDLPASMSLPLSSFNSFSSSSQSQDLLISDPDLPLAPVHPASITVPQLSQDDDPILSLSSSSQAILIAEDAMSQDSSVLSSAPSFLLTPSLRTMRSIPEGLQAASSSLIEPAASGVTPPSIFSESKKARKSWVWDSVNGEEYLAHGKWRWRCVRCKFYIPLAEVAAMYSLAHH